MASLNDIQYSILDTIRTEISDDDSIDLRQIADEIHKQRALWLRNELNKNRTIHPAIVQDLGCVEMELSDTADCCDVSTGCLILRTKKEIPRPLELHNKEAFTRIGPVDKITKPYSIVPYTTVPFVGNGKFNRDKIFSFYFNERVYLVSKDPSVHQIQKINIRGVFEDPELIKDFDTCAGTPCFDADSEYPIMEWVRPYIEGEVIKKFLPQTSLPKDAGNDGTDRMEPISQ